MEKGREPISGDEVLYRRIPVTPGWYDPVSGVLNPEAFQPHKIQDATGLSISRGKYKTIEEAALGRSGKSYFVAVLSAKDVMEAGMVIEPRPELPTGYDPSHAELPDLNSGNRKTTETQERQRILVELCQTVEGPFATPPE